MTRNYEQTSSVPGYVSIKDAAKILGLSASRVYEYVEDGRLPSVRAAHVILIPVAEVENFKPKISGRPRKSILRWRISPDNNILLSTSIVVQMRDGCETALMKKLEEIRQEGNHVFPGTISRFVIKNDTSLQQIEIVLLWRSTVMPSDEARDQALQEFQQSLEDVLDWSTARYSCGQVLLHT